MSLNTPVDDLRREVANLAGGMYRIAQEMADYADAIEHDETLEDRLSNPFTGAPTVVQILDECLQRTRRPDANSLHRALAAALAECQRRDERKP